MNTVSVKVCSSCKEAKPADLQHFHRCAKASDGLQSSCKVCKTEHARQRRADPEKAGKMRAASSAWKQRNPESGRKLGRAWREANPERARIGNRKRNAQYRTTHRISLRARARVNSLKWRTLNPEAARAASQNSRAKRCAAEGTHTKGDILLRFELQGERCYWCGSSLESGYHVDHIIALSRGGTNHANNLCCACAPCNLQKHAKAPWEFIGRLI